MVSRKSDLSLEMIDSIYLIIMVLVFMQRIIKEINNLIDLILKKDKKMVGLNYLKIMIQ